MNVVISQPMFIPWIGLFEQIKLADIFVHYDDVQMPLGRNFISRVQIKTNRGQQWMSAHIDKRASGKLISEVNLKMDAGWRMDHLNLLRENYKNAPYFDMMFELAEEIYRPEESSLAKFNQYAIELIASWLGLNTVFTVLSSLGIKGASTQRLVDISKHYGAKNYITGLGALNYLEYELFESNDMTVSIMEYAKQPYQQLYGEFIPYVTILDAVANMGGDTRSLLISQSLSWREYINESHR